MRLRLCAHMFAYSITPRCSLGRFSDLKPYDKQVLEMRKSLRKIIFLIIKLNYMDNKDYEKIILNKKESHNLKLLFGSALYQKT